VDPEEVIDLRTERLAELVAGLTGCEPTGALHAVRTTGETSEGDALEVVARAMVDVDQPPPEGFRVAGFLRVDLPLAHRSSHPEMGRFSSDDPAGPPTPGVDNPTR